MSWLFGLVAAHPWIMALIALPLACTTIILILAVQSDREFEREQSMDSTPADTTGPISAEFLARFYGSSFTEFENPPATEADALQVAA